MELAHSAVPVPVPASDAEPGGFDPLKVRGDFPVLAQRVRGKPLVYLDNAATSQVPAVVGRALERFHTTYRSNIHRGVHFLSQESTRKYEAVREKVARFLNAAAEEEIVFVRGTTEAINLVAAGWGRQTVKAGDEILISWMEHHSNIVPWQILCEQTGATLKVAPIDDSGQIIIEEYEKLLSERTKLVGLVHVSNALGTINPVKLMTGMAHRFGAKVLLDGAQAAPHMPVDVRDIGCDFYAFSGHKVYGPTGIGVLYGRGEILRTMQPYQGGGDMILSVSFEKTVYKEPPGRFEAGTPNIAGVIGLGVALDYVRHLGLDTIAAYEHELLGYGTRLLGTVPGLRMIGTAPDKAAVLGFVLEGIHPHDLGTILDHEGIAVRAGHHCAQPVMDRFGVPATTRASLAFYNTREELDKLLAGLHKAREVFG